MSTLRLVLADDQALVRAPRRRVLARVASYAAIALLGAVLALSAVRSRYRPVPHAPATGR